MIPAPLGDLDINAGTPTDGFVRIDLDKWLPGGIGKQYICCEWFIFNNKYIVKFLDRANSKF